MSYIKKGLRYAVMAITGIVVFCVVVTTYGTLKVKWAKNQVEFFCQQVTIGQSVAGLEDKAKKLHLNYRGLPTGANSNGRLYVWEGFVFDRWFCEVEYINGKAVRKNVTFLD